MSLPWRALGALSLFACSISLAAWHFTSSAAGAATFAASASTAAAAAAAYATFFSSFFSFLVGPATLTGAFADYTVLVSSALVTAATFSGLATSTMSCVFL